MSLHTGSPGLRSSDQQTGLPLSAGQIDIGFYQKSTKMANRSFIEDFGGRISLSPVDGVSSEHDEDEASSDATGECNRTAEEYSWDSRRG